MLKRIQEEGLEDFLVKFLIPSAKLKQFFDAAEDKDQQLFPGYMLIEMELSPEAMRLVSSIRECCDSWVEKIQFRYHKKKLIAFFLK